MIAQASPAAGPLRNDPSKRVNYTLGLVLGVDEFQQDQLYHAAGRRGHNRLLHGYGTVWGLAVTDAPEGGEREIRVAPGVAVDPCGREICVPDLMCVKVNSWLGRHQATLQQLYPQPDAQPIPLAVVLCHRECPSDTVPVPGEPCRSQEDAMQPSRIRESFELKLMLRDDAPWAVSPPADTTGMETFRLFQPEEQAVRAFGLILARVQTTTDDELSAGGRDELLAAVLALKTAADEGTLASPPAATDDPILLPAATAPEILREAFRVWVTEVRPAIRGQEDPGVCGDSGGTCCVLLAEIDLAVTSGWAVQTGAIAIGEENRPYLLHTRLLQEWLIAGGGEEGRPDVDSWATLQILGPSQVRAWVHHDGWVSVKDSVTVLVNERELSPETVSVAWAGIRNVWDVTFGEIMSDGDVVELRFDTTRIPLVSGPPSREELLALRAVEEVAPRTTTRRRRGAAAAAESELIAADIRPLPRWSPDTATPLEPPQTVADELKGPTGEYLDRYGWTLSAFTVYDKLEGGDLEGEYTLPIVAKIQTHPVSDEEPQDHDFLHWRDGKWFPDQLDEWSVDLREAYPKTKVVGLQTQPVSDATPKDQEYLVYTQTGDTPGRWEPHPLPPGEGDVKGTYPRLTVTGLQGNSVSGTAADGNFLRLNKPNAAVPGTWDSITFTAQGGDVTGTYPTFMVAALRGRPLVDTIQNPNQVLATNGNQWAPASVGTLLGPAQGGDLRGSWPSPTIANLQGREVQAGEPAAGAFLQFGTIPGSPPRQAWVPTRITFAAPSDLNGTFPDVKIRALNGQTYAATPTTDGEVLTWDNANKRWISRAVQGGGTGGTASGDLTGSYPGPQVAGLRGQPVANMTPAPGQFLMFSGKDTGWIPAGAVEAGGAADTRYQIVAAGRFLALVGAAGPVMTPVSVYNAMGLSFAGTAGNNERFQITVPDFDPDRWTYVVKAICSRGAVLIADPDKLLIEVVLLGTTNERFEIEIEVSRFSPKSVNR